MLWENVRWIRREGKTYWKSPWGASSGPRTASERVEQLRRGLEPGAGYQGQAAGLGGDQMKTEARELGHRRATRGSGGDPNVVQQLRKLSDYCCDSLVRRFGSISRLPHINRSIDRFEKNFTFVHPCKIE